MEDWATVSRKDIVSRGGASLFTYYATLDQAIKAVNPPSDGEGKVQVRLIPVRVCLLKLSVFSSQQRQRQRSQRDIGGTLKTPRSL